MEKIIIHQVAEDGESTHEALEMDGIGLGPWHKIVYWFTVEP
jgi:hypothetical protein